LLDPKVTQLARARGCGDNAVMPTKVCFVIAPIGEPESETRKRSDQVLKHVIRPAAEKCGYTAVRADEISEPGLITSQVIQRVVNDDLVIADLTERNPNVFYELAIRHAIRKPLVQVIRKGETLPFDIAGMRTIPVDHHDLDSVEEARSEVVRQIQTFEKPNAKIDTPITVSLELQQLRQSENPEQRSLAELIAGMADIRQALGVLETRISESNRQTNQVTEMFIRAFSRINPTQESDSDVLDYLPRNLRYSLGPADIERLRARLDLMREAPSAIPSREKPAK
jgi:hypothetical protein